jgi:hypothetical protein
MRLKCSYCEKVNEREMVTVRGSGTGPPSYTGHSSAAKDRSLQQDGPWLYADRPRSWFTETPNMPNPS